MTGAKVPFSDGLPWRPWLLPPGRHGKPLHWPRRPAPCKMVREGQSALGAYACQ